MFGLLCMLPPGLLRELSPEVAEMVRFHQRAVGNARGNSKLPKSQIEILNRIKTVDVDIECH